MFSRLDGADRSLSSSGVGEGVGGDALSVQGDARGGCDCGCGDESEDDELSTSGEASFSTGIQTPTFSCAYSSAVSSEFA